jgi:hypothetical protein
LRGVQGVFAWASQLFVLDIDGSDGAASLDELQRKHNPLPATAISSTGTGRHIWFSIQAPIPCSVGRVGLGLDIRGDGGYVVVPPSIHPNGKSYSWISSGPLAEGSAWLIDLARKRPAPSISQRAMAAIVRPGGYGQAALEFEIDALVKTSPGGRNHQLNRASFCLHQLVAGGELNAGIVEDRLLAAAQANGLLQDDGFRAVMATIRSGARAGLQSPRSRRGAA